MYRPRTAVIPGLGTVTPSGDVSAAEWGPVRNEVAWLSSREYDVRSAGDISVDAGPVFQSLIDDVAATGGGRITGPANHYHFLSGITLKDNVRLDFPAGTILDFSAMTTPAGLNAAISGEGTLSPLPSLAAPASFGGQTLTFSAAHGLGTNDIIMIYNPANGSFSAFRPEYRNGEYARVRSVTSTTVVELHAPLYASHPTSVQMFKLNPVHTGVSGGTIIGKLGTSLIKVRFGADLKFSDLSLTGANVAVIGLDKCFEVGISDININDSSPNIGTNYGIQAINSQSIKIDKVFSTTTRGGINIGGDAAVGCIPNRDIIITGCTSGRISSHGNSEFVTVDGNTIKAGYSISGDHTRFTNNTVYSSQDGYVVYSGELVGADHVIEGNTLVATHPHAAGIGHVNVLFDNSVPMTRTDGETVIRNNKVRLGAIGAVSGSTTGIRVRFGAMSEQNTLTIEGNHVNGLHSDGETTFGIWVSALAATSFRAITIKGNVTDQEIRVTDISFERLEISENQVYYPNSNGIYVTETATGTAIHSVVNVANNRVQWPYRSGIYVVGQAATDTTLFMEGNISLSAGRVTDGSVTAVPIYAANHTRMIYRKNTIGDVRPAATAARADTVNAIGELIEADNIIIGNVTTQGRSSVTTRRYTGGGPGVPGFAAADGSTYLRTDGAAGTTLYVRAGGAWVAK